jgi:hypothetical protein
MIEPEIIRYTQKRKIASEEWATLRCVKSGGGSFPIRL